MKTFKNESLLNIINTQTDLFLVANSNTKIDFSILYKECWKMFLMGEHLKCCEHIEKSTDNFLIYDLNQSDYFRLMALHLRLLQELNLLNKIRLFKNTFFDLFSNTNGLPEMSYIQGTTLFFLGEFESALKKIEEVICISVEKNNLEYLAQAIISKAIILFRGEDYIVANSFIEKSLPIIEALGINRIKYSYLVTKAYFEIKVGNFESSLKILFEASKILQNEKSLLFHAYVFRTIGYVYLKLEQLLMAKSYFKMAENLLPKEEAVRLNILIQSDFKELNDNINKENNKWKLGSNFLVHPQKGKINFNGQQTLLSFLNILLSEPSKVLSKNEIVKYLWNEEYDPRIHDNRIYVTVKRLRMYIEVNYRNPQYLIRTKSGYSLNQG